MIPYGHQDIGADDIDAVVRVLKSDFLTQGPAVPAFEQAVARRVNARHAVAVNSATSALHVACLALGLGPGDRLWTVPNTFVASANCALYCGAGVDFVDIDPATWNMSVPDLERRLVLAKTEGRLPKVVVPVHFAGLPTRQEEIWQLARRFGFRVVEDASHSIGASVGDNCVGSCRWSDITVFSFHPVKIITSAEGGMAMTNDDTLMRGMAMARSHGISRDPALFENGGIDTPPWHYEQHMLGFNYRMTDLHAALGLSQLARLDGFVERRNLLAQRYHDAFAGSVLQLPVSTAGVRSAFHLYVIRLGPDASAGDRRQMFDHLRKRGVGVNVHYIPVHLHPYYRRLGFSEGSFPQAEAHAREAITLPLYPAMTEQQQDEVIGAVLEFLG